VEGVQHSQGFIHPQGNNNPPQGEVGQDNHLGSNYKLVCICIFFLAHNADTQNTINETNNIN
jgi:hypothetical protein